MFDNSFDPYEALQTLNQNQQILNDNLNIHRENIDNLATALNNQQQQIDILIQGLERANKANELLMNNLLSELTKNISNYSTQGEH